MFNVGIMNEYMYGILLINMYVCMYTYVLPVLSTCMYVHPHTVLGLLGYPPSRVGLHRFPYLPAYMHTYIHMYVSMLCMRSHIHTYSVRSGDFFC